MSNHISRIREIGMLAKLARMNLVDQNGIDALTLRIARRNREMQKRLTLLRKGDKRAKMASLRKEDNRIFKEFHTKARKRGSSESQH